MATTPTPTADESGADPCYVAYCACGSLVAATVIRSVYDRVLPAERRAAFERERARRIASDVAEWIRKGLRVERVTSATVRAELNSCTCPTTVSTATNRRVRHRRPAATQPPLFAADAVGPENTTADH